MTETRWTASIVEARFEEAAFTLRRLPDSRVPGYFNTWPLIVRSVHEAFGYDRARMPRIAPTPQAISRMEETFTWLVWLEPDDARIVWLRAENVPWKPICWRVGLTRQTAWRRWVGRAYHRFESACGTPHAVELAAEFESHCRKSPQWSREHGNKRRNSLNFRRDICNTFWHVYWHDRGTRVQTSPLAAPLDVAQSNDGARYALGKAACQDSQSILSHARVACACRRNHP